MPVFIMVIKQDSVLPQEEDKLNQLFGKKYFKKYIVKFPKNQMFFNGYGSNFIII